MPIKIRLLAVKSFIVSLRSKMRFKNAGQNHIFPPLGFKFKSLDLNHLGDMAEYSVMQIVDWGTIMR